MVTINLIEIPKDGKDFHYTKKSSELNKFISDLIGDADYDIQFSIRPMEMGFELKGKMTTQYPEECSRCGLDYQHPLSLKIKELMLPKLQINENDHYIKGGAISEHDDESLSTLEFVDNIFNVSDFIHELIALKQPMCPSPDLDKLGNCTVCKINLTDKNFEYIDAEPGKKDSPFNILDKLKIK